MTTYVLGQVTILDPIKWEIYCNELILTLQEWGGEMVFRGAQVDTLVGRSAGAASMVVTFPNRHSARHWYQSIEYRALLPIQKAAAEIQLNVFESDS
ncbi:MAG: DUF1330 domain-containing protein [Gammaproteobacteria bacterium]|nr:DUF1330 domain-containing protein [Gammaproteobacteria bacterium]